MTVTGFTRVLAVIGAVLVIGTGAGPALAAVPAGGVVGGEQLGGQGVIVNGGRPLPDVRASSWLIADADDGQVLAAKDPHGYYRPASTLKVLTAVALIPVLNPSATVVASRLAASQEPNDIGLLTGQSYKVSDLFTALLTISANDAAVALAQAAGSYAHGMAIINAEARHLRAGDTVAEDPNGLDEPGQHTSAYDLALIARQALKIPAFMKYDTVTSGLFPVSAHKSARLSNHDSLITGYRGGLGGKTGWTSAAGATFVGMARRGGVTLIVSLLHCPALTEVASAEKLLDWGFAVDGQVRPVGTLAAPLTGSTATPPSHVGARIGKPASAARLRDRHVTEAKRSGLGGTSVVATIGFTAAALAAAGIGVAYSRRRRVC